MTIAEQEQVDAVLGNIVQSDTDDGDDGDEEGDGDNEGDDGDASVATPDDEQENGAFYVVDPVTGELKDPTTGENAEIENAFEGDQVIDIGDDEVTVSQ
jgi:hypothetical protein